MDDVWITSNTSHHILSAKYPISKAFMEGTLAPGFYMSYDEFINNSPSIKWTHPIRKNVIALSTYRTQNFKVQRLMISGRERQKIRRIIGYCDGKDIYFRIYDRYNAFYDRFAPVRFSGQFVTHASKPRSMFTPAGNYRGHYRRANNVLNMEDGQYFYLDKRNLRKLIQSNPALLASFERESAKESMLLTYFLKFIETQM